MQFDQHAGLKEAVATFQELYTWADREIGGPLRVRRRAGLGGRPIVLMPGASGTSEFFSLVTSALCKLGLDPINVDYSGTVSPDRLASALADYVKSAKLKAPVILGCSYSAWWMQLLPAEIVAEATLIFSNGFVEVADLLPSPLFDEAHIDATPAGELQTQWLKRAQKQEGPLAYLLCGAMSGWLPAEDLKGRLLNVARSRELPRRSHSGKAAIPRLRRRHDCWSDGKKAFQGVMAWCATYRNRRWALPLR